MRAKITYVYHNCFILEAAGRTLIFDYPAPEHRSEKAEDLVRGALKDADAYIFFSHSHADHCSAEILDMDGEAESAHYVLSYDVPDMIPELDVDDAVVVEPEGEEYQIGDLAVTGIESTDLGVAFLIRTPEMLVYYGGDLAEWTWDGIQEAALEQERAYFDECVRTVKAFGPDIAFSNLDLRLENLGGGPKLVREAAPKIFVPMHGFGKSLSVAEAAEKLEAPGTRVFIYHKEGDSLEVEL